MSDSLAAYRKLYPNEFYSKFLNENIRPDGRSLLDTRDIHISTGSINTAYGSSMVKLGNTAVVAGVQSELSYEDENIPSQLIINIEIGGISGTNFTGKPSKSTQALSNRLRSIVESCKLIKNLENLYIESEDKENKVLWYLIVDLYCLDHDGNIFDCCLIALISALKNVKLPKGKIENGRVIGSKERTITLDITNDYPLSLSYIILNDYILADPTNEEEELSDSYISIVVSSDNTNKIYQIYKPGGMIISIEKLKECITRTLDKIHIIRGLIDNCESNK